MNGILPSIEVQKRFINNNFYNYNKLSRIGFNKKNIYQNCQNYQNLSLHQNSNKLRNNPNFSIDSNIKENELISNKNTTQITYYKKGSSNKNIFNNKNNKIPELINKIKNKNSDKAELNNCALKSDINKEIIQGINNKINKNICLRNSNLILPEVQTENGTIRLQKWNSLSVLNKENISNSMNIKLQKNINNNSNPKDIIINHEKIDYRNIPRQNRGKTLTAISFSKNKKSNYALSKDKNLSNLQKFNSDIKNKEEKDNDKQKDFGALNTNIKSIKNFYNIKSVNLYLNLNSNNNKNKTYSTLICPICNKNIDNYKYQYHLGLHPSKILDWLYIGSYRNAYDKKAIKNLKINYVLNCAVECKETFPPDIKYCHLKLRDNPRFQIINYLDRATAFIKQAQNDNGTILVHCQLGISRSTTCVIAYFIKYLGYTAMSALNYIKTRRSQVMPNFGFLNQLKTYERNNLIVRKK